MQNYISDTFIVPANLYKSTWVVGHIYDLGQTFDTAKIEHTLYNRIYCQKVELRYKHKDMCGV